MASPTTEEKPKELITASDEEFNSALIRLWEIAEEKGMSISELGKQMGEVDPEVEGLAKEYAQKIHDEAEEHKKDYFPVYPGFLPYSGTSFLQILILFIWQSLWSFDFL